MELFRYHCEMTNAEKMISPDATRPDKFQSTSPWKTRIFQYSGYGAGFGAILFAAIAIFVTNSDGRILIAKGQESAGWPFIFSFSFAGLIAFAVIGGLLALYSRDLRGKNGKGA